MATPNDTTAPGLAYTKARAAAMGELVKLARAVDLLGRGRPSEHRHAALSGLTRRLQSARAVVGAAR